MLPSRIAIIGGGRWARVLVDELCDLVPASVAISVHSRGQAGAMAQWARARGLDTRLQLSPDMPRAIDPASSAIIVANAAGDHAAAVEFALAASIPLLVEKPIATSAATAQRLADLARERKIRFAAAHVFLFARYLENFTAAVAEAGPVQFLSMEWADPKDEDRHGERKLYDTSLAIHADLLPHVVSIAGAVVRHLPDTCRSLRIERGGNVAELDLACGDVPFGVRLERDGVRRRRELRVMAGGKELRLDFSIEPGIITSGDSSVVGDLLWDHPAARRPVASMLTAFLSWAAGGAHDVRLALEPGLRACELSDRAASLLPPR